jgi:hypothetical protein
MSELADMTPDEIIQETLDEAYNENQLKNTNAQKIKDKAIEKLNADLAVDEAMFKANASRVISDKCKRLRDRIEAIKNMKLEHIKELADQVPNYRGKV